MKPSLLVACDWSVNPRKRWMAIARLMPDGSYEVGEPEPVEEARSFFSRVVDLALGGPVLVGFDFPIGLPRAYAEKAGIASFRDALPVFGGDGWLDFYSPARTVEQISLRRPFYPHTPGGTSKRHLVDGLGVLAPHELLRRCERATAVRGQACEVFWTLGASQAGKAAISGWRDLLAPALRKDAIAIWPFDGELASLLQSARPVVAEIYPGEIYSHVGIPRGFGKRSREGRVKQARAVFSWCDSNAVRLGAEAVAEIGDGFGGEPTGEDAFDAFVGLLGLIEVARDCAQCYLPDEAAVRNVEGWILALGAGAAAATPSIASESADSSHSRM